MLFRLRRVFPALLGLALWSLPAFAASPASPKKDLHSEDDSEIVPGRNIPSGVEEIDQPSAVLRIILKPLKRGMLIRLPIMDTDPNRGVTGGLMPIWVMKEDGGERIKQIHAPSLTYNKNFGLTPTYRYYFYPQEDAALISRASIGKYEKEVLGHYEDNSFLGTPFDIILRVQYNVDAGRRFFGVGPDTSKNSETNYKEDYYQLKGGWGTPLLKDSPWRMHVADRLLSQRVVNGPLSGLPAFDTVFAGLKPVHRQQSNEMRLTVDFDSRDNPNTTTKGAFLQVFRERSFHGVASSFNFSRTGVDGRYFHPWNTKKRQVSAVNLKFEQLSGSAPFWLLPSLGGKYSSRAYGDGRYVDRSVICFNAEHRFTFYDVKMAGVTTEFELAPFAGVGTVADELDRYSARYARPVTGLAIRAVARPQVVGSIDFGYGQEGLAVFMDINYSF